MSRESIVDEFVHKLKSMNIIKLGKVQRDPIVPSELPKTAFPAVYVETAEEDRQDITMGVTRLRESIMLLACVIVVGGKDRDRQRNVVVDGIEKTIAADKTLNGNAKDCVLTRVELVEIGETEPYASCRAIFTIKYCYEL